MIEAGVANPAVADRAVADRAVADRASDGLVGDDAWLEMAVTCDPEAVEAVSEILSRVATGGVSVEPGFRLTDEGLRAVTDPSRTRRSATSRRSASGRSASSPRRSSTSPTGRPPGGGTSG